MGLNVRILASLSLLAYFTTASNQAKADTLIINAPITGSSYSYDPAGYGYSGYAEDTLLVTLPTLTNVSLANYTDVDFRISAPAGQLITLTQNANFNFNFNYVTSYGPAAYSTCSFTYTGTGPAPTSSGSSCSVGTGGQQFGYSDYYHFFAGDSFSALDFDVTIPANVPSVAPATFTYSANQSPEFTFADQTNTNPGPFASFTAAPVAPTPEPSSLILLGTGVLSVAGAARRRFKR